MLADCQVFVEAVSYAAFVAGNEDLLYRRLGKVYVATKDWRSFVYGFGTFRAEFATHAIQLIDITEGDAEELIKGWLDKIFAHQNIFCWDFQKFQEFISFHWYLC